MSNTAATVHRSAMHPERRARVRRARNFFIVAVLAALVSVAGHCLPGDAPQSGAGGATSQTNSDP
jgi:hypothetical protein